MEYGAAEDDDGGSHQVHEQYDESGEVDGIGGIRGYGKEDAATVDCGGRVSDVAASSFPPLPTRRPPPSIRHTHHTLLCAFHTAHSCSRKPGDHSDTKLSEQIDEDKLIHSGEVRRLWKGRRHLEKGKIW